MSTHLPIQSIASNSSKHVAHKCGLRLCAHNTPAFTCWKATRTKQKHTKQMTHCDFVCFSFAHSFVCWCFWFGILPIDSFLFLCGCQKIAAAAVHSHMTVFFFHLINSRVSRREWSAVHLSIIYCIKYIFRLWASNWGPNWTHSQVYSAGAGGCRVEKHTSHRLLILDHGHCDQTMFALSFSPHHTSVVDSDPVGRLADGEIKQLAHVSKWQHWNVHSSHRVVVYSVARCRHYLRFFINEIQGNSFHILLHTLPHCFLLWIRGSVINSVFPCPRPTRHITYTLPGLSQQIRQFVFVR